jgi:DNA polymerase IV
MRTIFHIDFNSYFATVEQQANPRLRGKPIGVTGGDRIERTVIGAASIEAKKFGVRTGMSIPDARSLCPQIILVQGDSDKYLATTKRFINILKDYSPYLEIFSIDECFLEMTTPSDRIKIAEEIKQRIKEDVGEWIRCSIGISYNKLMAKLAGSLYKPDGLVIIEDEVAAQFILDHVELNDVCGIGFRIKKRLNNMGIYSFPQLRKIPKEYLIASFKSYGEVLYNMARGLDQNSVNPFYLKEEVKSIGHRHTLSHNTDSVDEIKQLLYRLTELIARRLRAKRLVGRTVNFWIRYTDFTGQGMQVTIQDTQDGLEIFKASLKILNKIWDGRSIRMVGSSISNLSPENPHNLSLLEENLRQEVIIKTLDQINDRYGEFTLERGVLLGSSKIKRMPNPFLSDRRFKI